MPNSRESSYIFSISELIEFLNQHIVENPDCSKNDITNATVARFNLSRPEKGKGKSKSLYCGCYFTIKFLTVNVGRIGGSFSNTIIALSTLRYYDHLPFVVCVFRPTGIEILLSNSTFIEKSSHTSIQLSGDRLVGSILGSNILRRYLLENLIDNITEKIENTPKNFDKLFAIHQEFMWEDNLLRIIQSTKSILGKIPRLELTKNECETILRFADLASSLSKNSDYLEIESILDRVVTEKRSEIFEAAKNLNHKQRGDEIEKIVAQRLIQLPAFSSSPKVGSHELQDLSYILSNGVSVLIDVKTKVITLSSSPTAYNVDKLLKSLSDGNTIFCFFFIAIDPEKETLFTRLVSILDTSILKLTRIDLRWAALKSRGATQLTGDFSLILSPNYSESVKVEQAKSFLQRLIEL